MDVQNLIRYYENEGEEDLRLQPGGVQYTEFLTAVKYMEACLPAHAKILDPCAGSGVYSFYLARQGHTVTAGDLVPYNVSVMNGKQKKEPLLKDIYEGDIRNLSRFANESFDAVLCMGALYHMPDAVDRAKAVEESLRVLKKGGIFVGTYMNRHAVILNDAVGDLDNLDDILRFVEDGTEGIFYASTPVLMESMMKKYGVQKRYHVGLDGMGYFMYRTAGLLNETGFERWRKYHFRVCEDESILGVSYHGMFIGEKMGE